MLHIFDKQNYHDGLPKITREACRAIILSENKITLVKSEREGYYKFPGGGIEKSESHNETLIRETLEETGLSIIPESIKEFGMIKEIRKSIFDEEIFEQYSYYYFADVSDRILPQNLDHYEAEEGYHLEVTDIKNALEVNRKLCENYATEFISREAYVLELLNDQYAPSYSL